MSQELVRAVSGDQHVSVGHAYAIAKRLPILLEESAYTRDGRVRPATRANGRPRKPKTSVSQEAAKKAAKTADKSDPSSEGAKS